jgi:hypothetical protein
VGIKKCQNALEIWKPDKPTRNMGTNNKGKSNTASINSIRHGLQEHWMHLMHSRESKERRKIVYIPHEVADDSDYPIFGSNLSGLGSGRNWLVENGDTQLTKGEDWIEAMMEIMTDLMTFDRRDRTTTKDGKVKIYYKNRKVKDRQKLGKTDKKNRPETDLQRETIDLRPDHSRVIQLLIENGRKNDLLPILDEIRLEQIRIFEKIHPGRKVRSLGEHTDSGQYHLDHWHSGIEEVLVEDSCAIIEGQDGNEKILTEGKKKKVRLRQGFRNYGVGDGMASIDRHRGALEDEGKNAESIMGHAYKVLFINIKKAEKQNGEDPRDLALWRGVDQYVDMKLRTLDSDLCNKVRGEYVEWLEAGYDLGKLGIKEETLMQSKHKQRKMELDNLKSVVRFFLELILKIPGILQLIQSNETAKDQLNNLMTLVQPDKDPEVEAKKSKSKSKGVKPMAKPDPEVEM